MIGTISAFQLRAAADLISDPARWCQNVTATDSAGREVPPHSELATRWCAFGAIRHVLPHDSFLTTVIPSALDALIPDGMARRPSLSTVNDFLGHAAAVAELRRLADLAEAREAVAR